MYGEAEKRKVTCQGKGAIENHRMVLMVEHREFHGVGLLVWLILYCDIRIMFS